MTSPRWPELMLIFPAGDVQSPISRHAGGGTVSLGWAKSTPEKAASNPSSGCAAAMIERFMVQPPVCAVLWLEKLRDFDAASRRTSSGLMKPRVVTHRDIQHGLATDCDGQL